MRRGLDRKEEPFSFLLNKEDCSSTCPILVAWSEEKSPKRSCEASTVLTLVSARSSREDSGTTMLDEDKPLTLVLNFENTFSTLSWEGYSCDPANRT